MGPSFHPNQQRRLIQEQVGGSPLASFRSALKTKRPWDCIQDFAMHPSFCGQKLYPRQLTLLKLIYLETENMTPYDLDVIEEWRGGFKKRKDVFGVQPDVWERVEYLKSKGYTHFPHVQSVLGRRAGKGFIGGILGAERIAYFHSLDSWQKHFGIKQGTEGWLQVYATSQQQAQRTVFADIRYLVESCKYLQPWISTSKEGYFAIRTPSDLRRIAELESKNVKVEREIASLKAIALSSNSATGRGLTTYCIAFDEMAHLVFGSGSTKSGEEIYESAVPATDQFGTDRLVYAPSSPLTKIGKFFELYQHGSVLMPYEKPNGSTELTSVDAKMLGLTDDMIEEGIEEATAEPEMLIFQGPSWINYQDFEKAKSIFGYRIKRAISSYDDRMKRLEQRNPEKFRVERLGQFADVQNAYLDPEKVDAMFVPPTWREPLVPQDYGKLMYEYRIHCDPGRCLVGDTYINTDQGMVKIVQVEVGDRVVTRDGIDSVVEWVPNGIKDVYRLTLQGGWEIRATGNHPVWTERGWVPLQDLRSDDKVQVRIGANLWPENYVDIPEARMPKRCNSRICFPPSVLDERMGRLFGYIAAEGSVQETMLTVTSHIDEKLVDEVASLIRDLFGIEPSWERIKGKARTMGWGNNQLILVLQALGFSFNEHCRQRIIPWSIMQSPKSVVAQYISAYFSGDGCVSAAHHRDRSVTVSSASGEMIKQLQVLLANFGIYAGQYSGWRASSRSDIKTQWWKLSIRGMSLERFRDDIGFLPDFHEKIARLDYLVDLPHTTSDPSEFHLVKSLVADGREPTYDLSMQSDHHNFLANGIVCHNTNANYALAIGHLEDAPPDEHGEVWPCVIIDYLRVWKPRDFEDHTIDYVLVQNEIADILRRFPSTSKISFDQWNAAGAISMIKREFSPKIRVI